MCRAQHEFARRRPHNTNPTAFSAPMAFYSPEGHARPIPHRQLPTCGKIKIWWPPPNLKALVFIYFARGSAWNHPPMVPHRSAANTRSRESIWVNLTQVDPARMQFWGGCRTNEKEWSGAVDVANANASQHPTAEATIHGFHP